MNWSNDAEPPLAIVPNLPSTTTALKTPATSPDDLLVYHRLLEEGYDCVFGSRFIKGGRTHDYPRLKLLINRVVNFGIRNNNKNFFDCLFTFFF